MTATEGKAAPSSGAARSNGPCEGSKDQSRGLPIAHGSTLKNYLRIPCCAGSRYSYEHSGAGVAVIRDGNVLRRRVLAAVTVIKCRRLAHITAGPTEYLVICRKVRSTSSFQAAGTVQEISRGIGERFLGLYRQRVEDLVVAMEVLLPLLAENGEVRHG